MLIYQGSLEQIIIFDFKNLKLSTYENDIKNILSFYRLINNSPKLIILNQFFEKGDVKFSLHFNFDQNGKINDDYEIKGEVRNLQVRLLKLKNIQNINFNEIKNNYSVKILKKIQIIFLQ